MNYPVCATHLKWAPCMLKSDYRVDCKILENNAYANEIARKFHGGLLTLAEAMELLI